MPPRGIERFYERYGRPYGRGGGDWSFAKLGEVIFTPEATRQDVERVIGCREGEAYMRACEQKRRQKEMERRKRLRVES